MFEFLRSSPEARFWHWFAKHSEALLAAGPDSPLYTQEVGAKLREVHPSLVWEASAGEKRPREFVISADGDRKAFSVVEKVVDAAPSLPGWTFIRFRPREPNYASFRLEYRGLRLEAKDIKCALYTNRRLVGVEMFIRGCPAPPDDRHKGVLFLLLDGALGEYDVECKLAFVEVLPFDAPGRGSAKIPWAEFRAEFDRVFESKCLGGA